MKQQWKVFFEAGFWRHHGHDHAGKEVELKKGFIWGGFYWVVPAMYLCGMGLVIDICRRVEAKQMLDFMAKWGLTPENESQRSFSKEEEQQLVRENPLNFDFRMQVVLNGKPLNRMHGYGTSYNSCVAEEYIVETEAKELVEYYGLDDSFCWEIRRFCFPWNTKRKPLIKTLEITMIQEKVAVPGSKFFAEKMGDRIEFTYPEGGQRYALTVLEYEQKELALDRMNTEEFDYPTHHHVMMYTIVPELPKGLLTIMDANEGDRPRQKPRKPVDKFYPDAVASIGIIGGADGPTVMFLGSPKPQVAFSSLHFEPVEKVEWKMTFYEKQIEDEKFVLI